jgi:hypothetical protein
MTGDGAAWCSPQRTRQVCAGSASLEIGTRPVQRGVRRISSSKTPSHPAPHRTRRTPRHADRLTDENGGRESVEGDVRPRYFGRPPAMDPLETQSGWHQWRAGLMPQIDSCDVGQIDVHVQDDAIRWMQHMPPPGVAEHIAHQLILDQNVGNEILDCVAASDV